MKSASGHSGSPGVSRIGQIDDRILLLEVMEWLKNRLMLDREPVVLLPLDEPDPDGHLSQVEGVGIDLDPKELMRPDLQLEFHQTAMSALDEDLFLQVFQHPQSDVKEVPRSTGGVKDADRSQALQKGINEPLGFLDA